MLLPSQYFRKIGMYLRVFMMSFLLNQAAANRATRWHTSCVFNG